ncbi:DUF1311 domain-containing protein [Cupriavidus necator]|uniref:DUF1311 domain-containing protein n=1 Tax=Cupriavidus necator TaxID=106590 RepID=A0A1U9UQH3_CUPNE|nr:lysozyme inhibitor LprI family protein [Cupriavidus necator]AQV94903.1 DUF1311 domain-containing protein [Cupriavidus necator]
MKLFFLKRGCAAIAGDNAMKKNILFLCLVLVFTGSAIADSLCAGNVTRKLEECARRNFESSDKKLNDVYRLLIGGLSGPERQALRNSQREWIKYKDKMCQGAYVSINPGNEAGIEKFICLNEITKSRTKELWHIDTASGISDFMHAVDIVSRYYEDGDRNKFLDKLAGDGSASDDKAWSSYVSENCKLTATRFREEKRECVARLNFYRY